MSTSYEAVACSIATAGAFLAADKLQGFTGMEMHVTPVVPQKRAKKTT